MTAPDDSTEDREESERLQSLVRRVEELTTDIGSVLHANTSILFMAQQSIDAAIRALYFGTLGLVNELQHVAQLRLCHRLKQGL